MKKRSLQFRLMVHLKNGRLYNTFEPINERLTRVTMSVNYEMPFGPLGSILDKAKFAKSAARGMETALFKVRGLYRRKWLCSSIHYTRCIPKTACRKEKNERCSSFNCFQRQFFHRLGQILLPKFPYHAASTLPISRTLCSIIFFGTGIIACLPISRPNPGFVTLPTPFPP